MRPRLLSLLGLALSQATTAFTPLNITAIATRDGYSVLECWQLSSVPVDARAALNYAVGGDMTRAEWSIIRPRTTVGEAWAPAVQLADGMTRLSVILNGLIRITAPASKNASMPLPGSSNTVPSPPEQRVAYIQPGSVTSSLVIAADLKAASTLAGHFTEFPGDEPTVLVQVPWDGDAAPEHTVVGEGPCEKGTWTF
ncbi:hypothetical protein CPLU01_09080 [Colletotrichum plurivorum]|uniref:Small secreted protein n=1 Tax=Colletotrichum plurivorum TaxID=2175906 RepID=A0A8H6NCF6_9PEZI|nr:hypothetical protein CPLU01_09080 [Colletotrichum plurivorum]